MRLLFFYTNDNTQCRCLLEENNIPNYVEQFDLNEHPHYAEKYNIVKIPLWVAVYNDYNFCELTDELNITKVIHWFDDIKQIGGNECPCTH